VQQQARENNSKRKTTMTTSTNRPQKLMACYFGGLLAVVLGGTLLHYGWELTPWRSIGQFLASGVAEGGTLVAKHFVLFTLGLAVLWAGHIVRRTSLEKDGPWSTWEARIVDGLGTALTPAFGLALLWHVELVLPPEASAIQVLSVYAAINALMWAAMTVVLQRDWLFNESCFMLAFLLCIIFVGVTGGFVADQKAAVIPVYSKDEMSFFGFCCGALHVVALIAAFIGAERYLDAMKTATEEAAQAKT
jgi:hypothetical protein